MSIIRHAAGSVPPRVSKQILVSLVSFSLLFTVWPQSLAATQDPQAASQPAQAPPYTQQTPEQLQQLVAPIALYPDSLVAQILAASTFPEQVVEADRWVQANPNVKGDALGQAVDQQPWDPSVKALTAFPSVLGNMDKNLSWTSSLGDAYYNDQQDVMDAVQVMRQRAQAAGDLKTTPQQTVATQGATIVIQPASPDVVYVPAYDPWLVYGAPIMAWPGWYPYPGIWFGGPYLSFGMGFGIGFYGGYGWGWPHWGFDWHNHAVIDRAPRGREEVPVQLSRLLDAHQIIIGEVRILARLASKLGDDGTNDLLISDVLRGNELQAWFLSEHLVEMPLVHGHSRRNR
jgi:hypothetical protein